MLACVACVCASAVLPHCQLVNFFGGGHEVTMELPDECAAAVGAFLLDPAPENWYGALSHARTAIHGCAFRNVPARFFSRRQLVARVLFYGCSNNYSHAAVRCTYCTVRNVGWHGRSMSKRTEYLTAAVDEGKASAQAYRESFETPKL
jgi:hypothetical protein